MKILMCASEVVPFAKTGGLADVVGALPLALEAAGEEVAIVMPGYKAVQGLKLKVQSIKQDISCSVIGKNIKVYFIENEKYFHRESLYGNKLGDYPDNLERFAYYCRRALQALKEIDFHPDIIHIHDWQAALIPVYLKNLYADDPFYSRIKTLLTIHNLGYQGLFDKKEFPKTGLDEKLFVPQALEFFGRVNILKGGLVFADAINTVSPTYSREIQGKVFGFGLEGVLQARAHDVSGILNGLDYSIWNPSTDKFIKANFNAKNIQDKQKNKEDLQKISGLKVNKDVPLFGIVSRLAEQKGFDILAEAIDQVCRKDLELVILGTGDLKYHQILEKMVKKYPGVICLALKFDDALAHKIYAGSDIFLMPSKYEPCGLGQLIALGYGTIPLVFKTGGLADTVNKDNGFVFDDYSKDALLKIINEATAAFARKDKWLALVQRAMACDFSWAESAKKYILLYEKIAKRG